MNRFSHPRCRAVLAALAALLPVPAAAGRAEARPGGCPGAAVAPQQLKRAERALLCLVNAQRRMAHLPPVHPDRHLARAAARHSRAMVRSGVFEHRVPAEAPLAGRVQATGYLSGARTWSLAETLAYGSGALARPTALMRNLLASPPHRAIILSPQFDQIGIGLVRHVPGGGTGASLTMDFGLVRR